MTKLEEEQAQIIKQLREENALLREKIDLLVRKVFGSSTEKVDLDQLLLFEEQEAKKPDAPDTGADAPEAKPAQTKKRTASKTPRLPGNLPTEETVLLPEEVKDCPNNYRQIGEEVTEQLDYTPACYIRKITRRPKFVKRLASIDDPQADNFFIHPLPPSLIERSLLTPSLAAHIAVSRYCDHQPYHRQQQSLLLRHGIHLPRNTMCDWMHCVAHQWLLGVYQHMHEEMLGKTYLQIDETPIDYLSPGHGETKTGYLWTISSPEPNSSQNNRGDILYFWHNTRSSCCLNSILQIEQTRFTGTLQSDGYQAYQTHIRNNNPAIEHIACWAHVRRKFVEAKDQRPKLSGWILKQIRHLYRIEAHLREQRAGPALREAIRTHQSLPIYRRLQKTLQKIRPKVLPKSLLGKAIDYALGQWPRLEQCFHNGLLEVDNNLIENGIRPTKLGAKNWLFMGSDQAGQTNAILFSIIESCRRRGIDPYAYLNWALEQLPTVKAKDISNYTPKAYAQKLKHRSLPKTA